MPWDLSDPCTTCRAVPCTTWKAASLCAHSPQRSCPLQLLQPAHAPQTNHLYCLWLHSSTQHAKLQVAITGKRAPSHRLLGQTKAYASAVIGSPIDTNPALRARAGACTSNLLCMCCQHMLQPTARGDGAKLPRIRAAYSMLLRQSRFDNPSGNATTMDTPPSSEMYNAIASMAGALDSRRQTTSLSKRCKATAQECYTPNASLCAQHCAADTAQMGTALDKRYPIHKTVTEPCGTLN